MHFSGPSKVLVALGAALVGLFSILGFGGAFDGIVRTQVLDAQKLEENGVGWEAWKNGDSVIHFYFFNITNPTNLAKGMKASVKEVGPYVYREEARKVDVTVSDTDDTVQYKTARKYFFDADLSAGTENDQLVLINTVYITMAATVQNSVPETFIREQTDQILSSRGEKLVMTGTVRQFLFDGVPLKSYMDIFRNPAVEELGLSIPDMMGDGKYALFKNKNGSVDDTFVVKRGDASSEERGKVVSFNEKARLQYWRDDTCNALNGTDGSTFPAYISKDSKISIYAPGLCRSVSLNFHQEAEVEGLSTLQFVIDLSAWKSSKSNPDNWCFCTPLGEEKCDKDGVLNISPCTDGTPILLSQPHFLGAEDWIVASVSGLQPDAVRHMTSIDFHPLSGTPIKSAARVQYSIELHPYADMPSFAKVKHAVVPIVWFEEIYQSGSDQLDKIKFLGFVGTTLGVIPYAFMGVGVLLIGAGILLSVLRKSGPSSVKPFKKAPEPATATTGILQDKSDLFGSAFSY